MNKIKPNKSERVRCYAANIGVLDETKKYFGKNFKSAEMKRPQQRGRKSWKVGIEGLGKRV